MPDLSSATIFRGASKSLQHVSIFGEPWLMTESLYQTQPHEHQRINNTHRSFSLARSCALCKHTCIKVAMSFDLNLAAEPDPKYDPVLICQEMKLTEP
jgi:hypothetical protein